MASFLYVDSVYADVRMIVVRMRAGLGNQLFQYAIGRRLALESGEELLLDTTWFDADHESVASRHFNLPAFDVDARIATHEDLRRIFDVGGVPVPRTLVHCLNRSAEVVDVSPSEPVARACASLLDYYWEIRRDPPDEDDVSWPYERRFCPRILDVRGDAYLAGFWQSPKYFDDVADTIRRDLRVSDPPRGPNAAVAADIEAGTAVGVHVRRGDFARRGVALPASYYETAAATLADRLADDASYFIFSDDPSWAEANVNLPAETTYVTHNDGETDYEDLRLLRRCDHQIVANSTFSWWGAWLNENPDKRVLIPWERTPETIDFFPEGWETVAY